MTQPTGRPWRTFVMISIGVFASLLDLFIVNITFPDLRRDFASADLAKGSVLVLVGPGHPDALGFTIGCIRIGRFKICLECGWFYCRIVIKGTF